MRILILNWRDIKNPRAGGAEILTYEIARRWVILGHKVIQFSSYFNGAKEEEIIDGIRIIRKGKWWNVHIFAFFYFLSSLKNKVDIVIDEVHWFPFFSVLYARKKTVLLACEVVNGLFFEIFPYPLALLGRMVEKFYLWLYRDVPTLAISQSTKKDLINEGFLERNITVLPMGLTLPKNLLFFKKEKIPTLIYVGRINKQKGVDDAVDAFSIVRKQLSGCMLWIVGKGEEVYVKKIKNKINSLGVTAGVKFLGFVSEEKKFELMSRAHILLVPSAKEGWGLVVSEAGLCATPAVVYDVSGLHDVVRNNVSGLIVKKSFYEMAKAINELLLDKNLYQRLQAQAIHLAETQSWDKTAKAGLEELKKFFSKDL